MLLFQPLPYTPFSALGLSVEAGLGSSLLLCDLDFKAEMVPGADSQRALSLALPGRTTAGPFCLVAPGVQVKVFLTNSSMDRASPAVWLIVCLCHGACHRGKVLF